MKIISLFISILLSLLAVKTNNAQTLTVLSFNIRYDNPNDGKNGWEFRKESVNGLINHYRPQIFGIQEGLYNQNQYLKNNLKNYSFIGVGREDGEKKGEYSPIFFDSTQFKVIKNSIFWLSDRPDTVSAGWDAALERICTYGLFQNIETGKRLWVFNTHFDHMGVQARKMSALLILKRIKELNTDEHPVILMGDFNTTADSEPIEILKSLLAETSSTTQKPLIGPSGTFNNFDPNTIPSECIDFIFVLDLEVLSCSHIDDKRPNNLCISDHYPVLSMIRF